MRGVVTFARDVPDRCKAELAYLQHAGICRRPQWCLASTLRTFFEMWNRGKMSITRWWRDEHVDLT